MTSHRILSGVTAGFEPHLLTHLWQQVPVTTVLVVPTEDRAEQLLQQMRFVRPLASILHLPAWDCLPYDRIGPSQDIVTQRLDTLATLFESPQYPHIIITSANGLLQRLPPRESFRGQTLLLKAEVPLKQGDCTTFLTQRGYIRTETVREAGEYAIRGDIIDIFPVGFENPVRIDLFGDTIERLRLFDPASQTTIGVIEEVHLKPSSEVSLTPDSIARFRHHYRESFGASTTPLYEAVSEGRRHAGMEHWTPLFFDHMETLFDYVPHALFLVDQQVNDAIRTRLELVHDYHHNRTTQIPGDESPPYNPLRPEKLFLTLDEWERSLGAPHVVTLTYFTNEKDPDFHCRKLLDFPKAREEQKAFDLLRHLVSESKTLDKQVILAAMSDGSRERLLNLLADHSLTDFVSLDHWPEKSVPLAVITYPLEEGFDTLAYTLISEQDLLGERIIRKPSKKRRTEKLLLETSQLATGDLVVHRDHGIGQYIGLETIDVDGARHDCLSLVYDGGDKLFLPVENIEVITKYGNEDSGGSLDKLGSVAWQNRKARVKKRIREIADYLIKLAAERVLHEGTIFEKKATEYDDFCARFPYPETDDQLRAIDETLEDMSSGKPMDRLICGDVGFGKTEVALRAAFMAVSNGKQVAVITPTTLLCRQHFQTFSERFRGFNIRVEQLSRFVTQRNSDKIRADLAQGEVDIIIATHTLFSDKTRFSDLGLVIIDEEQHFGVKQKEKLKTLQKDVHVLTLTATPIPRTLQLALTGVREMSLIATPPIDRLAVRTFVTPYDALVIREAILREHYRGGQSFFVCPRLEELTKIEESLRALIPEIKITVAHGQLSTHQLEEVMIAFYDRQYDLLLSTNIVESGIDIPSANTLVIHRADLFGLAQLYQLRGRVGRSKAQGYAYLTLPADKTVSPTSLRRLEIMQTLDKLGAGFTLASHDLDIRGTGNLVGEEQSGHMREVGVELYQHLLQEAIMMVRAEQEMGVEIQADWMPQINLGTSVMIPETYVSDLNLRLNLYRRIANLTNREEIDTFAAEMIDRFGKLPEEVQNLFEIIEIKNYCRLAGIEKVDVGPKGLLIAFRDNKFANPGGLLNYIQDPKTAAKLRPDQKVFFAREWTHMIQRVRSTRIICGNLAKIGKMESGV